MCGKNNENHKEGEEEEKEYALQFSTDFNIAINFVHFINLNSKAMQAV